MSLPSTRNEAGPERALFSCILATWTPRLKPRDGVITRSERRAPDGNSGASVALTASDGVRRRDVV